MKENVSFVEHDEVLGWKGKPFATGVFEHSGFSTWVSLNSQGFRERDVPFEKPKDRLRILVLGDSQTWGFGVGQDERFTDILENLLLQQGISAEVLNLGINGYGTDQEFLLFNRLGVRYCPDIVIVAFYWNDVGENSRSMAHGYPKPQFVRTPAGTLELRNVPVPKKIKEPNRSDGSIRTTEDRTIDRGVWKTTKHWLETNSYAYRFLAGMVRQSSLLYQFAIKSTIAGGPIRDPEAKEWKVTKSLLENLKEAVKVNGSNFLVVVIPELSDLETASHSLKAPLLDELRSLPTLDLFPAMKAAGTADMLYYRDAGGHLKAEGHHVIGQAIFEYLIRGNALTCSNDE